MSGLNGNQEVEKGLKKIANSVWGYFIHNRRMAIMIGLIFTIVGVYSYTQIPRETNPEIKIPFGIVATAYPGASPQEVADQVTFKIEQKIKNLEDLKLVTSSSSEGMSQISVEFEASADLEDSIRKLKDVVDEATPELPADANDPFVQEVSFSDAPIVTYSFFADLPYDQLLAVTEKVQTELEKVKGVESANITGERQKNILIAVREADMVQYGLNLRMISQAISSYHLNSPVGNIEVDDLLYRVKIQGEQEDVEKIKAIPLTGTDGALVYLQDVAEVREEFGEQTSVSRVSLKGEASFPALSISVVKKTGANILETAEEMRSILDQLKEDKTIPASVQYLTLTDMAEFVEGEFNSLMSNALQTVLLIFVVLLLALGFKPALIGGISIPFTFLVAFTFLYLTGNTFNFLVLFSLILGLGLLVDTTIVVMEGMHDFLHKEKLSPLNAALKAVKVYRFPLLSGLLTTIAAFIPMYLMSGIMGEFFKYIPTTVNIVLISAFVIGLFIIPAYAVMFMKEDEAKKEGRMTQWINRVRDNSLGKFNRKYTGFLDYLLSKKSRRVYMWLLTIVTFIGALALPVVGLVKVEGFPPEETDSMTITLEAPMGFTLDKLEPIVQKVEAVIQKDPDIESYVVNLGSGGSDSQEGGGVSGTNMANFTLNFVEEEKRSDVSYELAANYNNKLSFITEAEVTIPEIRGGPPTGSAIQVLVFGDDYGQLQEISAEVKAKLTEFGGAQVDDNIKTSTAEFTFDFSEPYTKALLKTYGLSVAEVAQEVRMAVFPTKVMTIKRGEEEVTVNLQKDWDGYKPTSIDEVEQIQIQNNQGEYVALGSFVTPKVGANLTSIEHYDTKQAVTISADAGEGKVPAEILAKLTPYLESYNWPMGYSYEISGANDDVNQSFQDLGRAMIVGILLIFLILVTQFNSFKQPFVILLSLPLSLIGVLFGFFIFQFKLGVATMIGIVALTGIVINDAIVLIDRINENRRTRGMGLKEAIIEAGPARLQPILITSITTVFGILPISLTDKFWEGLGMAIVFGMIFSTVLTLIIIPVFYYSMEARGEKKRLMAINNTPTQSNETAINSNQN